MFIEIHYINGMIGPGISSMSEPVGCFQVTCQPAPTNQALITIPITSSPMCALVRESDILQIFKSKCAHAQVAANKFLCNFGWLCTIAMYIRAKYADVCDTEQEDEFLATQLSGYGPECVKYKLSQSMLARMYPLAT